MVVAKGGETCWMLCVDGDAWVVVYVECAVMIGRMRRAIMSGGSWVSKKP